MKDWHVIFGLLWLPCLAVAVWYFGGFLRRRKTRNGRMPDIEDVGIIDETYGKNHD